MSASTAAIARAEPGEQMLAVAVIESALKAAAKMDADALDFLDSDRCLPWFRGISANVPPTTLRNWAWARLWTELDRC